MSQEFDNPQKIDDPVKRKTLELLGKGLVVGGVVLIAPRFLLACARPSTTEFPTLPTATAPTLVKPAPRETPKPKEVVQRNPVKLLPLRLEITDSAPFGIGHQGETEEGWRWVWVELGFENVSRDTQIIGLHRNQFSGAKLLTEEGFEYGLFNYGNHSGYCTFVGAFQELQEVPPYAYPSGQQTPTTPRIERGPTLLPGFRIKGVDPESTVYSAPSTRMCFKVARNSSGYSLQILGFPKIDLEKEIGRVKNLKFPTDRPDSDFKDLIGSSFKIPNKGIVSFVDVRRGKATHSPLAGYKEPDPKAWVRPREVDAVILKARFENASQGYEQNFSLNLKLLGDDGIMYSTKFDVRIGPGVSKEVVALTAFPLKSTGGKLIVTGDLNEVFNLRVP